MAFMAAAIPYITAAAAVISTVSAIQQSKAASKADKFNASVAQENVQVAQDQTGMQLLTQQTDTYRKLGALKAAYGASGVTSDGSPADVLADSYAQSELDANTIIYNGKLKAAGYTNTANLDNAAAKSATKSGYIDAASKALLGASRTYSAFNSVGTNSTGSGLGAGYTDTGVSAA